MTSPYMKAVLAAAAWLRYASVALIITLAIGMVALTTASAFGWLPWLSLDMRFGDTQLASSGLYLQLFFTALSVALAFYLPAHSRMMQLENSHRRFQISMEDVTRAYRTAHEGDRDGLFQTGSEFDAVRERLAHLRAHPDLALLEPEVLELAAQMSVQSRDLAQTYSSEKVERARTFLRQRQQEMETFQEQLSLARRSTDELKHWMLQLETDERTVDQQVETLTRDLKDLLPQIGLAISNAERAGGSVVPLTKAPRGLEH